MVIPSPKRRDVLGRPLIQRDGILPEDAFRGISDGGETAFANRRGRVRRALRSPLPICLWQARPTSQKRRGARSCCLFGLEDSDGAAGGVGHDGKPSDIGNFMRAHVNGGSEAARLLG